MTPPAPPAMEIRVFRGLLLFALLLGVVGVLYAARSMVLPFLLAGLWAYIANPLVGFFESRGLSRSAAVSLLYIVVLAGLGMFTYWGLVALWEDLPSLRYEWPRHADRLRGVVEQGEALAARFWPGARGLNSVDRLTDAAGRWAQRTFLETPDSLSRLLHGGLFLVLVPFVGFFLLLESRRTYARLIELCPGRWVEKALGLLYKADEVLGNYIRGVVLEALAVGLTVAVGLWSLGLDQAALLGAAAGLANFVPYLGPAVVGALSVAAAVMQFQSVAEPLKVAVFFAGVRFVDDWFFQPWILKRAVHLHPVAILFALLVGGEVAGLWGLLLAVPLVSLLKETLRMAAEWIMAERGLPEGSRELLAVSAKPWIV